MKITKQIEVISPANVICDRCHHPTLDSMGNLEYAELSAHWGPTSRKDTEYHEFHFCEECYDFVLDILMQYGIEPRITERL